VLLGPFEINVPDRAPYISPVISVHIQGTALREPYCAWTAPDFLVVGRRGELSLRLFNRDPAMPLPKPELLWRGVPVKTVVEEAPLSEADRKEGIALRLTVIPLDSGGAGAGNMDSEGSAFFTFDALQLRHEGVLLTVPALRIPVVPAKKEKKEKEKEKEEKEASGARETPSAERPGAGGNPAPLFPETPLPVFPPARGGYEKALGKVRLLWDQGRRAECLAEIRRLERDTLQGPYFALSRREAERRLGFAFSADEPWRPRVLLFGSLFGSLGALVFPGLSVRRLAVSRRRIPLFQAVACAALLTGAALSGRELLTAQRQALFREDAPVYRIPDGAGGISAYLREGEPARVLSVSEYWIHIETLDGRIGWTRKDTVIFY
jgi:hypothetical protein